MASKSKKRATNRADAAARNRLLAIHDRLLGYYGEPPPRTLQDPLSELIQTVLSQNTADVNSDRAYASLMQRFGGDWDAVRAARQIKVTWETTSALPGNDKLYERMRSASTPEEQAS